MSIDSVTTFLPTLERLRREPLLMSPPGDPILIEPLAMLIVKAALVRRTSWSEEVETAPEYLQRGEPPPPPDYESRHHVRIDERLGGGGACPACTASPGLRRCRICGGHGLLFRNHQCSCDRGWIVCPTCNGSKQSNRVRLRYYSDTPAFLNEAYMPTHISQTPALFRLETVMEEDLRLIREVPELLRCHDLTGEVVGTAYRGGQRTVRPKFHGHDFGDTIDKALAGLAGIGAGANVIRYQIHAYAWPFLRLCWSGHVDRVAYVNRFGELRVFDGLTIPKKEEEIAFG